MNTRRRRSARWRTPRTATCSPTSSPGTPTSGAALTLDRPAASKTGTSEDFRDNVVMGYTPDLAAGVWMGNADNTPMAPGTFSSAGTGPMWKAFMLEAHQYYKLPPREFEKPKDVTIAKCGGRDEVFKTGQKPSKPGVCTGPGGDAQSHARGISVQHADRVANVGRHRGCLADAGGQRHAHPDVQRRLRLRRLRIPLLLRRSRPPRLPPTAPAQIQGPGAPTLGP